MMKYNSDKAEIIKDDRLILVCIAVLIFIIHIIHVGDIGIFTVLDDEYGYWGNAAFFAGVDWSNTVSKIPYYSYGYSLLLVPLFWIFNNSIYMYKTAIIFNGILLSISFLLCYDLAKKIMNNVNKYILMGISFLISMYPTYIVYSNIAWCECVLIFIFWLLTWCFLDINEKSSFCKFILIGTLSGYIYIVHQRAIGILIASLTVVLTMKIFNKINIKQLFGAILPIILIMAMHVYTKDIIQSKLWLNNVGILINDYSGQIGKLYQLITFDGMFKVFKEVIGQSFYLGASTYLIFYFGLYELIQHERKAIISSLKSKTSSVLNNDGKFFLYIFILIAFFLSFSISVIFMINPTGIDHLVYGRYNEITLGPIMLLGFARFMENEAVSNKFLLIIFLGFGILTVLANLIIKVSGLHNYQSVHIVGLSLINNPIGIYLPALIGIGICRLIFLSIQKNHKMIVTIITISCIFIFQGELGVKSIVDSNQKLLQIVKVTEIINSSEENLPIYFLFNNQDNPEVVEWNSFILRDRSVSDCYQFILKDKNIKPVNVEELSKISGEKFVITTENIDMSSLMKDYEFYANDNGSYLYVSRTSNVCKNNMQ